MTADPQPVVLPGPVAYRRSVELLEQAFATRTQPGPFPGDAPEIVSLLPDYERDRCIAAAAAYAALAQVAATIELAEVQASHALNNASYAHRDPSVDDGWGGVLGPWTLGRKPAHPLHPTKD